MCSAAGDIEEFSSCVNEFKTSLNKEISQNCKKCGENSSVLLQKKDPFCRNCFSEYCNHKFRSTIGKSKKVKHDERVLIAYSGGRKSAALLHLTQQTLQNLSLKQISFSPGILFINETFLQSDTKIDIKNEIFYLLKNMMENNYPVLYSSLEMVYKINSGENLFSPVSSVDEFSSDICCNPKLRDKMNENFKEISLSSKADLLKHLRLLLIAEIASQTGYHCVFIGNSASSLAVDLLTDIACGRGSQIMSDTCFYDTRYKVPICRPLREFLNKEVAMYNYLHNVEYVTVPDFLTKTSPTSSIQRLSETFLSKLQENFPATIFTVFRTGGKLSKSSTQEMKETCIMCKSHLDNVNPDPCSAIEALKISERLSSGSLKCTELTDVNHIDFKNFLCHGCSVMFQSMTELQYFYPLKPEVACIRMERNQMHNEVKDFLIDENYTDS